MYHPLGCTVRSVSPSILSLRIYLGLCLSNRLSHASHSLRLYPPPPSTAFHGLSFFSTLPHLLSFLSILLPILFLVYFPLPLIPPIFLPLLLPTLSTFSPPTPPSPSSSPSPSLFSRSSSQIHTPLKGHMTITRSHTEVAT